MCLWGGNVFFEYVFLKRKFVKCFFVFKEIFEYGSRCKMEIEVFFLGYRIRIK